jgi:F-type H+-transporting ATPase subunit epsilon
MPDNTFKCTVLTPERAVLDTSATFVAIPAHDGEIGIMNLRAPLLCRLGVGIVRMETPEGAKRLFIDAGFAQMLGNHLSILTEQAATAEEVDVEAERTAQQEASDLRPITPEDHAAKARALARAAAKIKLATR